MMQFFCCFAVILLLMTGAAGAEEPQQPVVQPVPMTGAIEQPAPLGPATTVLDGTNPFRPPKKRLSTAGYGKVIDGCQLRGIIKVSGRQVALFAVESADGRKKKSNEEEQLRRVRVGEQMRVLSKDEEHLLTLRELGERSAVIVGDNNQQYKVWL